MSELELTMHTRALKFWAQAITVDAIAHDGHVAAIAANHTETRELFNAFLDQAFHGMLAKWPPTRVYRSHGHERIEWGEGRRIEFFTCKGSGSLAGMRGRQFRLIAYTPEIELPEELWVNLALRLEPDTGMLLRLDG
jgi:hypothetical protein